MESELEQWESIFDSHIDVSARRSICTVCLCSLLPKTLIQTSTKIYDSELILRKEPYLGCVSTAEPVARVLSVVEQDGVGIEAERLVVGALGQMVRLQKGFLKPYIAHRSKLKKKGKIDEEVRTIQTSIHS